MYSRFTPSFFDKIYLTLTIITDLIRDFERVSELIEISKSHKVSSKTKSLAKEMIKLAAQRPIYQVVTRI